MLRTRTGPGRAVAAVAVALMFLGLVAPAVADDTDDDGVGISVEITARPTDPDPSASPTPTPTPTVTVTVTAPPHPGDLYSIPGFHSVNGRWWYTACEPYSQTVRCWTEIWSTQVHYVGGRFLSVTGWHFNNLTYLPFMTRAAWGSNPLANTGQWTSAEGRHWRTECDTPASGRNGCRSWIWASYVSSSQNSSGVWVHKHDAGWVVNNLVRFR